MECTSKTSWEAVGRLAGQTLISIGATSIPDLTLETDRTFLPVVGRFPDKDGDGSQAVPPAEAGCGQSLWQL